MTKRPPLIRAALAALLAALLLLPGLSAFAQEAAQSDVLQVTAQASPAVLAAAGSTQVTVTLRNMGDTPLENVEISQGGVPLERVGELAAHEEKTFTAAVSVSEAHIDAGSLPMMVVYTVDGTPAQLSVPVALARGQADVDVEFTRDVQSVHGDEDGRVTIVYTVKNNSNVPLQNVTVTDTQDFLGRADTMAPGENGHFTMVCDARDGATSAPVLRYTCGGETYTRSLGALTLKADASLLGLALDFDGDEDRVHALLTNASARTIYNITVTDAEYGGVLEAGFDLPAGQSREMTFAFPARVAAFALHAEGVTDAGDTVTAESNHLAHDLPEEDGNVVLTLDAQTDTPVLKSAGFVHVKLRVGCSGAQRVRDVRISEETRGLLTTLTVVASGEDTELTLPLEVREDTELTLRAEFIDEQGYLHTVYAPVLAVRIGADGVAPMDDPRSPLERMVPTDNHSAVVDILMVSTCALVVVLLYLLVRTSRRRKKRPEPKKEKEKEHV